MSDIVATDGSLAVGQRMPWRLGKRSVTQYKGSVGNLRKRLPTFRRRPNRYREHEIFSDNSPGTVVGHVSPGYVLIQHGELLDALPEVISEMGYELGNLYGELTLTSHGERMELLIDLPYLDEVPSDGFALACRLRCVNSVDRSTALAAEIQWYRQICSNGMFGWSGERLRRVHRFENALGWVQNQLIKRFENLPSDRLHFKSLMEMSVRWNVIQDWADVFIARKWGKHEAARVLSICRTGNDGNVQRGFTDEMAHELEVSPTMEVPGACAPVMNAYHVGQALSWVAGQSETLHTRFSRTAAIPVLLRYLMN